MRTALIAPTAKRQAVAHPSKSSDRSQQLALLTASVHKPVLSIDRVPDDLALGRDRYYIQVSEGSDVWRFPLQFQHNEARALVEAIAKSCYDLALVLSENGVVVPIDYRAIAVMVERAIGGASDA